MASLEDENRGKSDANQIYLLTGKNYRISRSIKVLWFFQHFNCVVCPNPDHVISSSKQELEVLSVLPKGPTECSNKCVVVPSTLITFLGRIYKFVFCLDVSQSLANVDILSGKVVNEISFESFKNCVRGLVLPFSVPGSTLVLSPELHLTILGYNGVVDYGTVQVLVEGFLVNQGNVEPLLSTVYDKLRHMENKNASVAQGTCNQDANDKKRPLSHVTTELSIVAMLKMSLLALQLLPGTASGGIVVISDGVFGLPSAAVVHALLAELRSHTVCCSFVKVGSPFQAHCSFGYIPNIDLMQFLSVATSGAYLCKTPPIEELAEKMEKTVRQDLPPMNFYHKAFLCWSFQREYDLSKISSWEDDPDMNEFLASKRFSANIYTSLPQWKKALTEPLIRKRHLERTLKTTISSVLSVRLREGYCIEDITFHRGGKELAVKLLLLWKQNVRIEYTATCTWPVSAANPQTRIEVVVQGNYEFLHDVYSKQLYSMKGYRANVVETFNHTLKSLEMTDALIVSLQSFSSNRVYYTIPESARRGVPLFYLPPNSPQPVLSLEQGKSRKSSKSQEAQFGVFWKTILSLDVNIWQRWMHCHRINMVLEHDRPLPKSLYLPVNNDRFYPIQCRNALSSLATLLKQWSSFVLLDNHTYIKFVEGEDPEGPPRSFCILRLSSKAPCVVIRLAFLGGMPGRKRHEVVNALRDKIKAMTTQFASLGNLSKDSQKGSVQQEERQMHEWLICTKLLHKPLDRILVRYDELPKEFLVRLHHSTHSETSPGVIETFEPWMYRTKGASESPLKVLSRCLYHQRWVFTLRHAEDGTTPSANTISKILRCITKLREHQGYKFIASHLGVTTMFKELWVKETSGASEPLTTCVVQFVMFPPLTSATHNRVVGWALDNRLPEDDRDLQLVMEVWVEPQEGVIMENEKPEYLTGKHYYEIPAKIFEADLGYISAWLTYDHLRRMCDDRVVCSPGQAIVDIALPPNDPEMKSLIYEVPFPFDVLKVLRCSKRTEIMFSTLIENEKPVSLNSSHCRANDVLFDYILEHMKRLHDRELILTAEDSQRFSTLIPNKFLKADPEETVIWRCFTRVESGHLLLTFLPASYNSLQTFCRVVSGVGPETGDGEHNTFDGEQPASLPKRPSSHKDQLEHGSADSPDDDTSKETLGKFWCSTKVSKRSSADLSLFVYDFTVSSLAEDDLSGDRQAINEPLLDYRNKLDRFEQDKSLEMSKESRSHSMAIYELFSWCFVSTVFESLRRGESVDDNNLDDVLAICSDHIPEEIDITEFLGNICGHINPSVNKASQAPYFAHEDESYESQKQRREESATEFLRNNCDSSASDPQWGDECENLSEIHDFIQKRFAALLGKYFAPIPNKMDHYFYRPYCLQDSFPSDGEEKDGEAVDSSSDGGSDVVFESDEEEQEVGEEEYHSDNLPCQRDEEIDKRGSIDSTNSEKTRDDLVITSTEYEDSDYPSDLSDLQSSSKDGDMMNELRDIEQEYNVPLFLNLSYTIRDRSHLSSTMVSMSAENLPTCLAEIVDQAKRDPDQCIDSSISSLLITLDLICLVPPREPDYSRWKSRNHYRARSNSLSSLSSMSDTPLEKIVRFDDVSGTNHDRESSFTVSGLPHFQIDSIREIKHDINWLLQDEIVFSLCHAPSITLDMLENVTKHISQSLGLETQFSQFRSIQLHFVVLDAEQGLAIFIKELDKVRIGGYKLSKLENYYYLRLSSSTAASSLTGSPEKSNTTTQLSEGKDEIVETESKDSNEELLVDFTSLFSEDSCFPNSAEEDVNKHFGKSSSRHQSQSRDAFSELWLILKKTESDTLDVYFHTRETHDGKYHYLYVEATHTVQTLFHLVNQKLLLQYVYDERVCHPLLQPRSEDDIWNESRPYSSSPHSVFDVRNAFSDSKVVNPEYRFQPGHFNCPVQWTKHFPIHFRLRGNTARNTAAVRAIKALQTVLVKFSLNEKTNMYVYREKTDIYYFSLDESLCVRQEVEVEGGQHGADYGQEESLLSQPISRSSSYLSLSKGGTAELEEDLEECARKRSGGLTAEKDTVSLNGSLFSTTNGSGHVEPCIVLCVHGVTEPGDEIKIDLVSVLQKRLDDFTLEMLMMSLARNANTKLALQDVQFIQPPESTPVSFIRFVLPSFASKNLHPFSLFFKQHLLDYLHTPRYTTKVEAYHFQKFVPGEGYLKALAENDVFIFSKPCIPGAKGVACLSVNITDSRGNTLHISPDRKEMGFLNHARKCSVKESTLVQTIEEFVNLPTEDSDGLPVDAIVIEIFIWERGDVGISLLRERLRKSIRHALCDVLIEYYLLTASFSYIPEKYNCANPGTQERYKKVKTRVTPKPLYPEIHIDISSKSEFKQSHRRTPSAGSLGCGRRHSPATPTLVFRPSVSEPVTPISFGSSVSDSTETCRPGNLILIEDEEDAELKTLHNITNIGGSKGGCAQTLLVTVDSPEKVRSHSVGSQPINKSFQPIPESSSHANKNRALSDPHGNLGVSKQHSKSGRFSPFETFTENELTESKEFGEEATMANDGSYNRGARKMSTESARSLTEQEMQVIKRCSDEMKDERTKYENGDKGELHPSFQGPAQELLQFAKELDSPSLHVQKGTLLTRYSVDAVLYELMNLVKLLCPDLKSKIYRAVPSNSSSQDNLLTLSTTQYVLYDPIRQPLLASDKGETSVDRSGSYMATSAGPAPSFLLISRNVPQWRNNLQRIQDYNYVEPDTPLMLNKDFYASQQFQSWNWDSHDDANERTKETTVPFSNCAPGFVSRQRLVLMDIKDKEIIATTYNLSSDIKTQLSSRLTRLVNWNNARCHLVSCLFHQKMGLFHHTTFQGLNVGEKDINPFCETVNDHHLFSLLKQTAPERSASSQKQIPSVGKLLFEETLRDVIPPKPLHTTKHCSYRDPVKRHGAQFQEIRAIQIRKAVQNAELHKLFTSWLNAPFNIITGDNSINLLKRHSRLIHFSKTPFLVSDEWMTSVQEKANIKPNQEDSGDKYEETEDDTSDEVKEYEWHYKLREEFINYYTQYVQSQTFALVQSAAPASHKTAKGQKKPSKPVRKKAVSDRSNQPTGNDRSSTLKPLHYYLQKTTDGSNGGETYAYDGGIMLLELGYEGCYFFVKLYAFDSSRLNQHNLNQQTKNTFLTECSKMKELTHLNSFSYDFHLRHVQYFLFGQRLVFPKGFRLTAMLSKLMNLFIYPPKFSWNHVCRGQLPLKLCNLPRSTVFSYIVEHARRYGLSTVEMNDKDEKPEHVLVSTSSENAQYDVSLLVKLDPKVEENILGLKFFVVMTHRRELFPKMNQESSKLRKKSSGFSGETGLRFRNNMANMAISNSPELENGEFKGVTLIDPDNLKRSSSTPQFATPVLLTVDRLTSPHSDERLRLLSATSDGSSSPLIYSTSPQTSAGIEKAYVIKGLEADPSDSLMSWDMRNLEKEAVRCCDRLHKTVSSAQEHCMRDHLWHLLLKGASSDETMTESNAWKTKGLRKKTEYRRNLSDYTETWPVPSSLKDVADSKRTISCEDFEHLLDIVKPVSLPVVDETLKPFLSMDTGWYINLWSFLLNKFGDRSREFSKCEGRMHYFVLLNPKNLDMFIFISVDEEKRLTEVKIATRESFDERKKTARVVPKSCDDFVQEVVNALCYQMWTGLLLG